MSRSAWLTRVGVILLATSAVGWQAVPSSAAGTAGTASVYDVTKVRYNGGNGNVNNVVVTRSGNTVTLDDRVTIKAGAGCKAVSGDSTKVRCTTTKAPTAVYVYVNDGNDYLRNDSGLGMYAGGGMGNDILVGGSAADHLLGEGGNDTLLGRAGNDNLDGSDGDDTLWGGDGNDTLYGKWGNDTMHGGNGDDTFWGGDGNDKLYGDAGDDVLKGYDGSDRLEGGTGDDFLYGDDPTDTGTVWADVMLGGPGRDAVVYGDYSKPVTVDLDGATGDDGQAGEHDTVGADVEVLAGGSAADHLTGNAAANGIWGGKGNDVIHGLGGNDDLGGNEGRDTLHGDEGDDTLYGNDTDEAADPDHLDGGPNTAVGDVCQADTADTTVNCER
jgi:serralysin